MSTYLKLYTNNPTSGGTNGTEISQDHVLTSMVSATLDKSSSESKAVKCALRCTSGYQTVGDVTVAPWYYNGTTFVNTGGNIGKWKFAADNGYGESAVAGSITHTPTGIVSGDVIAVDSINLTAGTGFTVGADNATTATNLASALNANSTFNAKYTAVAVSGVITVTETNAGNGNTPGTMVITGTGTVTNGTATTSVKDALTHATWVSSLTVSDVIGATNHIVWVKISSTSDENPQNDKSTSIHVEGTIEAAA